MSERYVDHAVAVFADLPFWSLPATHIPRLFETDITYRTIPLNNNHLDRRALVIRDIHSHRLGVASFGTYDLYVFSKDPADPLFAVIDVAPGQTYLPLVPGRRVIYTEQSYDLRRHMPYINFFVLTRNPENFCYFLSHPQKGLPFAFCGYDPLSPPRVSMLLSHLADKIGFYPIEVDTRNVVVLEVDFRGVIMDTKAYVHFYRPGYVHMFQQGLFAPPLLSLARAYPHFFVALDMEPRKARSFVGRNSGEEFLRSYKQYYRQGMEKAIATVEKIKPASAELRKGAIKLANKSPLVFVDQNFHREYVEMKEGVIEHLIAESAANSTYQVTQTTYILTDAIALRFSERLQDRSGNTFVIHRMAIHDRATGFSYAVDTNSQQIPSCTLSDAEPYLLRSKMLYIGDAFELHAKVPVVNDKLERVFDFRQFAKGDNYTTKLTYTLNTKYNALSATTMVSMTMSVPPFTTDYYTSALVAMLSISNAGRFENVRGGIPAGTSKMNTAWSVSYTHGIKDTKIVDEIRVMLNACRQRYQSQRVRDVIDLIFKDQSLGVQYIAFRNFWEPVVSLKEIIEKLNRPLTQEEIKTLQSKGFEWILHVEADKQEKLEALLRSISTEEFSVRLLPFFSSKDGKSAVFLLQMLFSKHSN